MTLAPHRPLGLRLAAVGIATATCLLFGVLVLRAFGLGPAFFLFALAGVGVVDLVLTARRASAAGPSAPPLPPQS